MRRPAATTPLNGRLVVIALICLAAVGLALVSQHVYGMEPCPWCVLQRVIFLAIAAACVVGMLWRGAVGRAVSTALVLLLVLSGIAAALWQHFYAAVSPSCNLTFADKVLNAMYLPSLLPDVFSPRASCADAAVSMLGVSYDLWSLALFFILGVVALSPLFGRSRT